MAISVRRVARVTLAVVLVFCVFCLWPAWSPNGTARSRAEAWVERQSTSLPTTLATINRYPREYRRAAYAALSAEQKADLWKEHLRLAARIDTKLTSEQADWLVAFAAAITAADFRGPTRSPEVSALEPRRKAVLEEHARLISKGAWMDTRATVNPLQIGLVRLFDAYRVGIGEYAISLVTAEADEFDCDCWVAAGGEYDCPGDQPCCPNVDPPGGGHFCQPMTGCDWTETRPCDGFCCGPLIDRTPV